MKLIPLREKVLNEDGSFKGWIVKKFALVDDEDWEFLMQWKWYAAYAPNAHTFYAQHQAYFPDGTQKCIKMHRLIMQEFDRNVFIDHEGSDGLNNQKYNLRRSTRSQNGQNRKKNIKGTSKYKGVKRYPPKGNWVARISANGKRYHIGYFDNENDAAIAYNEKAKQLHGVFAKLNIIQ